MEMSEELKQESEKLAEIFLTTMPTDNFKRYKSQRTHHQLAYFYCWAELMKKEFKG